MIFLTIVWSHAMVQSAQFILSLSIMVILHELGHFIPARIFRCRVERFYLFFNPWFSLFKKKIGETEYGIGWLPFGGYVKIAGQVDEGNDLTIPPQSWEFRGKPAWQRLVVMLGGVFVNFVLAFAIFVGIKWFIGDQYLSVSSLNKQGLVIDSIGLKMGLQDGDNIIAVAGVPTDRFLNIPEEIVLREAKCVTILRQGKLKTLNISPEIIGLLNKNHLSGIGNPWYPLVIKGFVNNENSAIEWVRPLDTLLAIDGETARNMEEIQSMIKTKRMHNQHGVVLSIRRGKDTLQGKLTFDSRIGILGIEIESMEEVLGMKKRTYSFWQAIPAGYVALKRTLIDYVIALKLLFTSKETKLKDSLGSVISLAAVYPVHWDWLKFWQITAILSIMLGVTNLLPIPALDGGTALFILLEMVSGRKMNDSILKIAYMTGSVLLLGIMIYALGLDIYHLFKPILAKGI